MVTVLCGKIAAGKTTLAKASGAIVLSCDDLMLALSPTCLGAEHDAVAARCLRFLTGQAAQLHARGLDVVIDYGFWTRAERARQSAHLRELDLPFCWKWVDAPTEVRLARLHARNESLHGRAERVYLISDEQLKRFDAKFEPPTKEELE